MAYGDLYQVGTATLDGGDASLVTITGALLLGNAAAGDTFEYAGRGVTIAEIIDNENLRLAYGWPDPAFESVDYAVIQDSPLRNPPLALARNLRDQYERLRIFNYSKPIFGLVEFGVDTPPEDYSVDDMLVIGSSPTGVFAGRSNAVARFTEENTWFIQTPEFGWHVISEADPKGANIVRSWDGAAWVVAAIAPFNVLGAYAGGTTYSRNDLVEDQDQSWVYVNGTPGAGNAPPTYPTKSNAHWQWVMGKGNPGADDLSGEVTMTGNISPASLSASQDNWSPTNLNIASCIWVTTNTPMLYINGLQGGSDGRLMMIGNGNTDPIRPVIIGAEKDSSTSGYRFSLLHDLWLWPGEIRLFKYHASRWTLVGGQPLANHLETFPDPFPAAFVKPVAHANYNLKRLGIGEVFTRATTQTYVDAQRKLQTAGVNVPCFDHDPVTGAFIGLVNPPASTNQLRNNSNTGAVVGVIGSGGNLGTNNAVNSNAGLTVEVAAFGTDVNNRPYLDAKMSGVTNLTSMRLLFGATNHFAAVLGETVTSSFGWKLVAGSIANITGFYSAIVERDAASAQQNATQPLLPNPTVNYAPIAQTRTVTGAATAFVQMGWGMTFLVGAAVDITIRFYLDNFEKQPYATPRIPTTNAAVTRAAPTHYRDVPALATLSGAMECKFTSRGSAVQNQRLLAFGTDANNYHALLHDTLNMRERGITFAAGVNSGACQTANSTIVDGGRYRVCYGWNTDDFAISLNGAAALTDSAGAVPAVADIPVRMYIGNQAQANHTISGILGWSLFAAKPVNGNGGIQTIAGAA